MELMDVNFKDMETVTKKCIYFSKSQLNKVVKKNKRLYSLTGISKLSGFENLYFEVGYNNRERVEYINLYEDLGSICYNASNISKYVELDKLKCLLNEYKYFGVDGFIDRLNKAYNNSYFINLLEIELLELLGYADLATKYTTYREEYIQKQEQKRIKEQKETEAREKDTEEERKAEIDKKLVTAETDIINGKQVSNEDIEDTTLLLMLFKKYDIKVPLKTQGWINKVLANIHISNGQWSYSYYSSHRNSTVFKAYLDELIIAIKAANNKDTSSEKVKL